jgi:hypothetical protein
MAAVVHEEVVEGMAAVGHLHPPARAAGPAEQRAPATRAGDRLHGRQQRRPVLGALVQKGDRSQRGSLGKSETADGKLGRQAWDRVLGTHGGP